MSDRGWVAGSRVQPPGSNPFETRAYLFDLNSGRAVALSGLFGDDSPSYAADVNNAGVAVGMAAHRAVVFATPIASGF